MEKDEIKIDQELLDRKAFRIFTGMAGIDDRTHDIQGKLRNKTVLEEAFEIRKEYWERLKVKTLGRRYRSKGRSLFNFELNDNVLTLNGVKLYSNEFTQIEKGWVKSIFIYMFSMEEIEQEHLDLTDSLYLTMWQTAYLDGAREMIRGESKDILSLGPGYFGMELDEIRKFHQILEGNRIGVKIFNGSMKPAKTCTGLLIELNETGRDRIISKNPCSSCKGNRGTCRMCGVTERSRIGADNFFANE